MTRIALIGAGSVVFTRNLCGDILLTPALRGSTLALMDIDAARLARAKEIVDRLAAQVDPTARVEAHLDRRAAVRGADFVITTFQQGGLEAWGLDIEIPRRYGVEQCVGDTLGPGGVFRALRSIPVLVELGRDLDDLAPEALLINYTNPMAANCWAYDVMTGRPHVGLCHSVQGTSEMLAAWVGAPYGEVVYRVAGINHQAWFLEFRQGHEDLYPRLREAVRDPAPRGAEPVRVELFEHFGYFVTESSGHASEYSPYFRKTAAMVAEELAPRFTDPETYWLGHGRTGGCLEYCIQRQEQAFAMDLDGAPPPAARSHEYGAYIIEAMVTNQPARIYGNVPNHGLIDNLPQGCCVEVPCLVDSSGVQPTRAGALPAQLAALNRTNVNVQELIVEAARRGDREAVHHAVMVDPLTAAACTLPQIRAMTEEMLRAQARWLPQFGLGGHRP
jgi:alpha-galactosidase